METRPSTEQDLEAIWPKLAPRMTAEYQFAGVTRAQAKAYFLDWIRSGQAIAIEIEHTPIAIMAWTIDADAVMTSFAATEEFFSPKFVRPFAHFLRDWRRGFEKLPIVSNSYSEHPATPKWFRTLGFSKESESGLHRVFVIKPH